MTGNKGPKLIAHRMVSDQQSAKEVRRLSADCWCSRFWIIVIGNILPSSYKVSCKLKVAYYGCRGRHRAYSHRLRGGVDVAILMMTCLEKIRVGIIPMPTADIARAKDLDTRA